MPGKSLKNEIWKLVYKFDIPQSNEDVGSHIVSSKLVRFEHQYLYHVHVHMYIPFYQNEVKCTFFEYVVLFFFYFLGGISNQTDITKIIW